MKIRTAQALARSLLAAADRAEDEGRDELTAADLDVFADADDAARAELAAAIAAAETRQG